MKIAVVTGSSYGLGLSISKSLLINKFKVYGVSRTDPAITDTNFIWIKADLLEDNSFESIKSSIVEDKIDLLVNNAGIVFAEKALEFTQSVFDKTFRLNLIAPIRLTSVLKSKIQNGIVVNISSTSDRFAEDCLGMYCASKTALNMYFDAIAIENKDIKILNILPVYIDTPMLKNISEKLQFSIEGATSPEKLAEGIIDVCMNNSKFNSGTRIIMLQNSSIDEINDPENLWYYNMDTNKYKKIK